MMKCSKCKHNLTEDKHSGIIRCGLLDSPMYAQDPCSLIYDNYKPIDHDAVYLGKMRSITIIPKGEK